jgi:Host cell surface-exposed lipoprotein
VPRSAGIRLRLLSAARQHSRIMNKKHLTAVATTALIAISGLGAASAQATTHFPLSPVSQENAAGKAQEYLRVDNFSRKGLIKQLEYDHFSADDAEYAVAAVTVDWNQQAAGKAKKYLDMESFSHDGLVTQLEYDGFTSSQAEYGVNAVGL